MALVSGQVSITLQPKIGKATTTIFMAVNLKAPTTLMFFRLKIKKENLLLRFRLPSTHAPKTLMKNFVNGFISAVFKKRIVLKTIWLHCT